MSELAEQMNSNDVLCEHFDREITILSDGTVTTCCVDNKGENRFASIYDNSFDEVMDKHLEFKKRYIHNTKSCPTCMMCLNNWKVRPYMYKSDKTRIDEFSSERLYPTQFVLEVTSRCNAVCQTCIHNDMENDLSSVRSNKNGFLDLDYLLEWMRPVLKDIKILRMYNYGEPFLHKGLEGFCSKINSINDKVEIGISSNGTSFGTNERIERIINSKIYSIIVSLHGGTEETVCKYMGPKFQFEKAVDNISRLMAMKKKLGAKYPIVNLKSVLFEWNDSDEEINSFANLAKRLNVDAYHFVPTGGKIGTRKYLPGSNEWKQFVAQGLSEVNLSGQDNIEEAIAILDD
jgi:uncharacterized Fe-S cluster-containing radical SAM superfamily enzyme